MGKFDGLLLVSDFDDLISESSIFYASFDTYSIAQFAECFTAFFIRHTMGMRQSLKPF